MIRWQWKKILNATFLLYLFPWLLGQNQTPSASASTSNTSAAKSPEQAALERANFLLRQAFEEDEQGNDKDAIELYLNAAEMCIQAVSCKCYLLCQNRKQVARQMFLILAVQYCMTNIDLLYTLCIHPEVNLNSTHIHAMRSRVTPFQPR